MSGTTSRTLRHYDAEGLLAPAFVTGSGHRWYEREQLLRLQEILLLRELGLGLEAIGELLAAGDDRPTRVAALRRHRRLLAAERDRLERLVATVDRTITELEEGADMAEHPEQWFTGFDAERQQAYEAEVRQHHGDEVVNASRARMAGWSRSDVAEVEHEMAAVHAGVAELMARDVPVDDPRTLDAVAAHHRWVSRFWTPDAAAYTGLGRMYVDDERFTATIDATAPGLAVYLRDAMAVYARQRLH